MTAAGADRSAIYALIAHGSFQVRPQFGESSAGERRDAEAWRPIGVAGNRKPGREIALVEDERERDVCRQPLAFPPHGPAVGICGGIDDEEHAVGAPHFRLRAPDALLLD